MNHAATFNLSTHRPLAGIDPAERAGGDRKALRWGGP